ncbi:hypothetical protein [[Clostridium] scindens]|nr:hypothetical protein [[Clostridium] scindens]EDS05915.1 hypothetical protein CLOSCI_02938 [[Clostridium] scindens ATCC 35704]MEE0648050.1 hypothetical protein [[Clostridium] scindens]
MRERIWNIHRLKARQNRTLEEAHRLEKELTHKMAACEAAA